MLFTVPHIFGPLITQSAALCAEMYDHLSSLDLADSFSDEIQLEVNVLVGSDYYWEVATGSGKGCPIAIHTMGSFQTSTLDSDNDTATNLSITYTLRINVNPCSTDELNSTLWSLLRIGIFGH